MERVSSSVVSALARMARELHLGQIPLRMVLMVNLLGN
jgi:hypothetical protein